MPDLDGRETAARISAITATTLNMMIPRAGPGLITYRLGRYPGVLGLRFLHFIFLLLIGDNAFARRARYDAYFGGWIAQPWPRLAISPMIKSSPPVEILSRVWPRVPPTDLRIPRTFSSTI